jgi:hypothetical protein
MQDLTVLLVAERQQLRIRDQVQTPSMGNRNFCACRQTDHSSNGKESDRLTVRIKGGFKHTLLHRLRLRSRNYELSFLRFQQALDVFRTESIQIGMANVAFRHPIRVLFFNFLNEDGPYQGSR